MSENDKSNKYALAALRDRRAAIAGEITHLESRLRYLRQAITHLDGALTVIAPDADPKDIKAKPYRRVKLFGAGKLNRMIVDALREGGRFMSLSEITEAVARSAGFTGDAEKGLRPRVRANLLYLVKVREMAVKEGDRATAVWRLA